MLIKYFTFALLCGMAATFALPEATAQDGGLLHRGQEQMGPGATTLQNSSFIYQKQMPRGGIELQKETIITVLVDWRSLMKSEGDYENRKTNSLTATLSDWISFDGKSIRAAAQASGDPKIAGQLNSQVRAEADMGSKDSMTFRIAAKIVDIRPNGNLVIEAHQTITNNEEVWRQSLTGVVDRKSIGPDLTVKSENVAELRIDKHEVGHVRDGYNRGWLQFIYDKYKPF